MDRTDRKYVETENQWDQQWPTEATDSEGDHLPGELDNEDELTPFPGVVGTTDELEAVRDAEPYDPPVDPPVLPGGREGIHVATGFGFSAEEEAAQDPPLRGDEDLRDEALLLLHQDSLASQFPLDVEVENGVIRLVGRVQSIEDADYVTSLLDRLPGVVDIIDDTTLED